MQVYQITAEEQAMVEAFNEMQTNTLLIICDLEGIGPCVVLDDLNKPDFKPWRDQFDVQLRPQTCKLMNR